MNGINYRTGTVHTATARNGHLVQTCPMGVRQHNSLVETAAEVTCKRCIKATPKPAAKPAAPAPARKTTTPVVWGVFNANGTLRVVRDTKREATTVAAHIGHGCYAAKA